MPRPLGQRVHKHYSLARVHGEAPCDWLFFIPCQSLFFSETKHVGGRGGGWAWPTVYRPVSADDEEGCEASSWKREKKKARSRGDVQLCAVNCAVISRVEIVIYMAPFFLVALRFSTLLCNKMALDNLFCKRQRLSAGHNYTKLKELCLVTMLRSRNTNISNKYTFLYFFCMFCFHDIHIPMSRPFLRQF